MRASSAEDERPAKKHEPALAHVGDADGSVKLPGLLDFLLLWRTRFLLLVPLAKLCRTITTPSKRSLLQINVACQNSAPFRPCGACTVHLLSLPSAQDCATGAKLKCAQPQEADPQEADPQEADPLQERNPS